MGKVELGTRIAYAGRILNGKESRENFDRMNVAALVLFSSVMVGDLFFLFNNPVDGTIVGIVSVPALIEMTRQFVTGSVRAGRERRTQQVSLPAST